MLSLIWDYGGILLFYFLNEFDCCLTGEVSTDVCRGYESLLRYCKLFFDSIIIKNRIKTYKVQK